MAVLPYENITLHSHLSDYEIIDKLNYRIEYAENFGIPFNQNTFKDWEGIAKDGHFKFRRIIKSGFNAFTPIVSGSIKYDGKSSTVQLKLQLQRGIYVSIVSFAVLGLMTMYPKPTLTKFLFLLLPYGITTALFNGESKRIKSELNKLLKTDANNG